ncbi:MAG TPA: hypothetical protein VGL94_02815 [Ktedonobacteraceae bacterium]|jgi:hypothetical protein
MMARVYGFDWEAYTGLVMPAFAHWLVDGNETFIHQLYQQTRCALEEQFIPSAMQLLSTWLRAKTFVQQLPRGPHTNKEYQLLCAAEQFTILSDSYVYYHPPQLYQNSDAIRAIWGAIVENHCQLQLLQSEANIRPETAWPTSWDHMALLQKPTSFCVSAHEANEPIIEQDADTEAIPEIEDMDNACKGVEIGRHPTTLHLRGWLAMRSVRAMALFELLACGRRSLPFGYRAGEPYEAYVGYLIPDEVRHLADCLRDEQPPDRVTAKADYASFRQEQSQPVKEFRMIDEVLPDHADSLMEAVHLAAQRGLGLICSIE